MARSSAPGASHPCHAVSSSGGSVAAGAGARAVKQAAVSAAVRNRLAGGVRGAYLAWIVAAVALVAIGGHFGGRIVFGPEYLPF